MSTVFTDQLAALPLSEVYIQLLPSGSYVAAIVLEGRMLNVYENEGVLLKRSSLNDILHYLVACGCPWEAFVGDIAIESGEVTKLGVLEPLPALAAM